MLSNEAFRRIGQQLDANYTFCPNSGVEDLDVNRCLRDLGVEMGVSVDELGRQRFLVLDLMRHYLGAFPNWLYRFSLHPLKKVTALMQIRFKGLIANSQNLNRVSTVAATRSSQCTT